MHRYFFSLRIAGLVILAAIAVASIDLWLNEFAVVHDPEGKVARVLVEHGDGRPRAMREFAAGYWAGRPRRDGAIRIVCKSGVEASGGYVTPGLRTTYTVRPDDCGGVAARAS
ncbi:hypothetical protein [Sphingomonas baiyangensis]|uniref:Uncharacterized protein n=1 Tax=Sphingomonas baiyangensis TaxID=2572576 RepID=A0A4U1L7T0_9SPHN|nr:hypothetical protein [Sphingomonas baiyangensis]TKD53002.1 hypothetical protein FBR43_01260 [Sphingomonas baiyangensis]